MMRVAISTQDISQLLTSCIWSGDKTQSARKLDFTFLQDESDSSIPKVNCDSGFTVYGADDDNNIVFVGNIYQLERDRKKSAVNVVAYDHLFVLNKSKTTRKYTEALPEDIAREICSELGVQAGNIASTGEKVSFIANAKTGYQIIQGAYTEAHKKNNKQYQCIMNGARLDVIEKGNLIDGLVLDSLRNMTDSIYSENIEQIVNRVMVVDESGNGAEYVTDDESIRKYSMFQTVYRIDKEKDTAEEAKSLMKKPEREGTVVVVPGDYRLKSGYSVAVKDANFNGQFWIKSDSHTWRNGLYETKLILTFENVMDEVKVEKEKSKT